MTQIKAMIKKCDRLFSECITLRDHTKPCITCDKPFQRTVFGQITCGHFQKRRYMKTRWNPENSNGQCWTCNSADDNKLYTRKMIEKFGQEKTDELIQLAHEEAHLTLNDLREIHKVLLIYKRKIQSL